MNRTMGRPHFTKNTAESVFPGMLRSLRLDRSDPIYHRFQPSRYHRGFVRTRSADVLGQQKKRSLTLSLLRLTPRISPVDIIRFCTRIVESIRDFGGAAIGVIDQFRSMGRVARGVDTYSVKAIQRKPGSACFLDVIQTHEPIGDRTSLHCGKTGPWLSKGETWTLAV
jgi:hypothetical protein